MNIFLSGWEYNRLLAPDPFHPMQSGLPAQVLWEGAAQFWLFEKMFCTSESLEGDLTGTELGWTTGLIFDDLRRRGFIEKVNWSQLAAQGGMLKADISQAWTDLRAVHSEQQLLEMLQQGQDDHLEAIKLDLLKPLLRHLNCVQNISPNSIRHWISKETSNTPSPVLEGLRALVAPIVNDRMLLRAGFTLCRRPGTGVPSSAVERQRLFEQDVQRPLIPPLLAGLLPMEEYFRTLKLAQKDAADISRPISQQLKRDYDDNIGPLLRLRDLARKELWPDLHGSWLPQLNARPEFLPEFKRRIAYALKRTKWDPYLKWRTDIAINTASLVVGGATVAGATAAGADPLLAVPAGAAAGGAVKIVGDGLSALPRSKSETLTLFYQKAKEIIN